MTAPTPALGDTDVAPPGSAPAEIDRAAVLERRARVSPERPAVTFRDETRTFAQVQDRVRRPAQVLLAGGVRHAAPRPYSGVGSALDWASIRW